MSARRVATEVPGPRSRELAARRAAAVPRGVFNTTPIFVERAAGAIVRDVDGNEFIDFGSGLAVLNVGNSSPDVQRAIAAQLELYTHTCMHVTMNEPYVALAERLGALAPGAHPTKTMFVNSGAEAVENAVKIARYATGRAAVVTFDHAFHGRTQLAMTMTAKAMPYRAGLGPAAPEVYRMPFAYPYRCPAGAQPADCGPACAALAIDHMSLQIGADRIACVVLEPVMGEGGFIVPAPGFVPAIAAFCAANGIVFVADEVQTGIGRTGTWFGIEHENVVPDLITMAKGLGGGLPLGAVTGRAELLDSVHVGGLGGTFGGNPLACAAAMAVLDQIERDGLLARATAIGERMRARLDDMATRLEVIGDVRGRGAMVGIELVTNRTTKQPAKEATSAVLRSCLEQGVIVLKAGTYDNVVRLLPPLIIDDPTLDEGLDVLEKAVATAQEGA